MQYLRNHKKIMLIITENCNLRCTYCYEQNKRKSTMDFETAKNILDGSFYSMEGYDSMVIELHGGEPFINFWLIKEIDEYVMNTYSDYPLLFRIITNGTMVHGEIQEWLLERKDRYEVMLSLDGEKAIHDRNRQYLDGRGSFDSIDLDFFRKTWPRCPVSMTVNEENMSFLAEETMWMESMGFDCLNAFVWASDWNAEKTLPILRGQLEKLTNYYIKNVDKKPCLLLRYNLPVFYLKFEPGYRYCVDIDDPLECYDAKGNYAPCHGFTEFTMGSSEKAKEFQNLSIRDFDFTEENICKDCQLRRMCRICFAANYMQYGNMQIQDMAICAFNQMCILYGIKIQRGRLAKKDFLTEDEQKVWKVAAEIEEYIKGKSLS